MAMDSHDDNHYELQIDTENNNHDEKPNNSTADCGCGGDGEEAKCSSPLPCVAAETLSGSSRRKACSLSKGLTIEEFLETAENVCQLTAIDKLLLKNKEALAEEQMKRARVKSKDKPALPGKKNEKNSKPKVLHCKVASTKLKHASNNAGKTKTNAATKPKTNSKTKVADGKAAASEKAKKPKPMAKSEKRDTRLLETDVRRKSSKKSSPNAKDIKNSKIGLSPLRKASLTGARKLNKEAKINCKSFDMKLLKDKVAYQTRSINKEKLRNGKKRILSSEPTKKKAKFKESEFPRIRAPKMLKRPIKEEPLGEVVVPRKKPKTVETHKNSSDNAVMPAKSVENGSQFEGAETSVKFEHMKQEVKVEPQAENSNVVEINVNMNIVPHGSEQSQECNLLCDNVKSETTTNSAEDVPVPNGLILQDFCTLRDYESSNAKSSFETNDVLLCNLNDNEEDMPENLDLQLRVNEEKESEESSVDESEDSSDDDHRESDADSTTNMSKTDGKLQSKAEGRIKKEDVSRDSIFSALGLQSIGQNSYKPKEKETKETKETKESSYTGTLKMVIKTEKGCRRMEVKQKDSANVESSQNENIQSFYSKTISSQATVENAGMENSLNNSNVNSSHDSSGMSSLIIEEDTDKEETKSSHPEVPLVNSINEAQPTDGSIQAADGTVDSTKALEPLVVPEKSSSFSIHPNRLCFDVCKYCFGKFGSLDTPCHVGQLKNLERQRKILTCEPNLRIDTCLCDACFRFVDRKANRPSKRKALRPSAMHQRKVMCGVLNCNQNATKVYGRRKWRSKICRKIANLSFDIRRKKNGVALGLCHQHYCMLDMYTLCGICKKRLNRNDMFSICSELNALNKILEDDGIPANLIDNMLLCKSCHHCMSLRLNYGDSSKMSTNNRDYYESFKKEILRCHNLDTNKEANTLEDVKSVESNNVVNMEQYCNVTKLTNGNHSVADASCKQANQNIVTNDRDVGIKDIANLLNPLEGAANKQNATHIQLKFGNLNIGKLGNLNIGQNAQPPHEKKSESLPSEKELPLIADFNFENSESPSSSWERCVSTIQFDKGTKKLWQDLQKPYGNQSSFIRHLIMLEKYWRSGSLVLSESADPGAVKYINSVKNRIESLETSSTPKKPIVAKNANETPPAPPPPPPPPPAPSAPVVPFTLTPPPLQPAPKLTNGPVETSVRPPSAPPPLLKLSCLASPFVVRKTTPVCAVKPSSDISGQKTMPALGKIMKPSDMPLYTPSAPKVPADSLQQYRVVKGRILPQPPKLETLTVKNVYPGATRPVPEYRSKYEPKQWVPIQAAPNHFVKQMQFSPPVSQLRKIVPHPPVQKPSMPDGNAVKTVSPGYSLSCKMYAKQSMPTQQQVANNRQTTLIFPKLPKGLTVRQVEDTGRERGEPKPPLMAAPFLVGEKPSVSVFREISK